MFNKTCLYVQEERNRKMRSKGIRQKVIARLVVFSVAIVILVGSLTAYRYYRLAIEEYNDDTYSYLRAASDFIDGDRIEGYLRTRQTDEYYDTVLKYLTSLRDETDMKLFYVFVPDGNDFVYVWQTDPDPYSWLGKHEAYIKGDREAIAETFRKDPAQKIRFYDDPVYGKFICGFYPVFDSTGEPVALVGLDLSTEDVAMNIFKFVSTICLIILIGTMITGQLYYVSMSHQIVRPIYQLNGAIKSILSDITNNATPEFDVHTGDELEELSDSFILMHKDIRHYIEENAAISAEKGRIDAELSLAAKIQESLLPKNFEELNERNDFAIYATMDPAKEVGGDFYDFFMLDDTHLAITMADVSGKGVPAAILAVITMIIIRNNARLRLPTDEVLERTNESICSHNDENMFVTVWFGVLNLETGVVTATNAGHEYPIIRGADGLFAAFDDGRHGLAIGSIDAAKYSEYEFTMAEGDALFLYTDGVPEATDSGDNMFGVDRTVEALNREPKASMEKLLANVNDAVQEFVADAEQFDDMTMLCVEYKG